MRLELRLKYSGGRRAVPFAPRILQQLESGVKEMETEEESGCKFSDD